MANCFDTLSQSRLFESLQSALCVRGGDLSIQQRFVRFGPTACRRLSTRFLSDACRNHHYRMADGFFANVAATSEPSLFADQHSVTSISSAKALSILQRHVFNNMVLVDGQPFVQTSGIPQGSLISSLLCSIHYGALDHVILARYLARLVADDTARRALPSRSGDVNALLRLVDDSLTVTSNATNHEGMLTTMRRGFPQFGCRVNNSKTRAQCSAHSRATKHPEHSTVVSQPAEQTDSSDCRDGLGRRFFPWCGSLINLTSCEFQPDFRRRAVAYPLAGRAQPGGLRMLASKFRATVKPKLRRIFVDPQACPPPAPSARTPSVRVTNAQVNSTLTVRRNVFHALLHAVMLGFVAARRGQTFYEPQSVLQCVDGILTFAARLAIANQCACLARDDRTRLPASTLLERREVAWLGWVALCAALPQMKRTASARLLRIECRLSDKNLTLLRVACNRTSLVITATSAAPTHGPAGAPSPG